MQKEEGRKEERKETEGSTKGKKVENEGKFTKGREEGKRRDRGK